MRVKLCMKIHTAWLTTVPAFLLVAACSDAPTATSLAPQAAQLEVTGTTTLLSECQAQIETLIDDIVVHEAAPITSKNSARDRAGLVKILSDANELLSIGKNADAVKKLTDYIVRVEQLKAAGTLDAAHADPLIARANDAIVCINGIGA